MHSDPSARLAPADPLAGSEAGRAETGSLDAADATDADAGSAARHADTITATPAARIATPSAARSGRVRRLPSFVRGDAPAKTPRVAWPGYVAIVALGLLLALQLLLAQRHELAASARWRPWVERLCNALPCTIPAWREPRAFTMLDRSVQPSPALAGVLVVEASFRNDARWPQPWPTVLLSLSDVGGRQVGLRAFAPSEYRKGTIGADDRLAPGQSATLRLQVHEPAPRIVAFTFDFQ